MELPSENHIRVVSVRDRGASRQAVSFDGALIERDPQAWSFRHRDLTVFDVPFRSQQLFNERVARLIHLDGEAMVERSQHMQVSGQGHSVAPGVRRYAKAMFRRELSNPQTLRDSAA